MKMESNSKKTVSLQVEEFLWEFYGRVARAAGKSAEEVMADALMKFAADAAAQARLSPLNGAALS